MKKKIIGILTITSIALTMLVAVLISLSGEFFSAFNLQLLIVLFTLSIVLTGIYLLNSYCSQINTKIKMAIISFGLINIIFSALVAFNIISFLNAYNWLIASGILYVLLVQLQLLNWAKENTILTKLFSILLILSNLFLIVYFIGQWHYSGISLWIKIAVLISVISFLLGVIMSKKVEEIQ